MNVTAIHLCFGLTTTALAATTMAANTVIIQDFDNPGTGYTLTTDYSGTPPGVRTGGPDGNYMEMTILGQNNTSARMVFDPVVPDDYIRIEANFDFRIGTFPDKGADGFSLALLSTAEYDPSNFPLIHEWEKGRFRQSFAMGVRFFPPTPPLGEDEPASFVSLNFNEVQIAEVDTLVMSPPFSVVHKRAVIGSGPGDHNFATDPFIRTSLVADFADGGAYVTVQMTTLSDNQTYTVFNNQFIDGFNPYETYVVFGARTGGLAGYQHLDNIDITFIVPEPASLSFLMLGGLALLRRRRGV